MGKYSIIFLFLIDISLVHAQSDTRVVYPNESFTNKSSVELYCLPGSKLDTLLKRDAQYKTCNQKVILYRKYYDNCQERKIVADSAITLRSLEAEFWKTKLFQTDTALEAAQIKNLKLEFKVDKVKRWRMIWVLTAVVGTSVLFTVAR